MATRIRTAESHVKLAAPQLPAGIRSGGENLPLDYPHLYQIQAGDWRISYAVEHNRLAILVLEVLNPPGGSSKDAAQESLTRKMKVKLLDWPEGAGTQAIPPEEISKKLKIKWLDLSEESDDSENDGARGKSRIKLKASSKKKAGKSRITLLGSGEPIIEDDPEHEEPESEMPEDGERKITPVDEPSM